MSLAKPSSPATALGAARPIDLWFGTAGSVDSKQRLTPSSMMGGPRRGESVTEPSDPMPQPPSFDDLAEVLPGGEFQWVEVEVDMSAITGEPEGDGERVVAWRVAKNEAT
jgi:hypothetical protein